MTAQILTAGYQTLHPQLTGLPVLETERLILRGPQASDWPAFRDYRASARTAFAGGPKKEHEAAVQFASFFGHWVMRGFGRLIAEDRTTGLPLGHFGPMQWQDGAEPELTWSLWTVEAEGRGIATEAARAMAGWVFGALGLTTARAEVHRDNAASHAIARRLGGQVVADERPTWFDDGDVYRFTAGGVA
jgi:[ribosomal protein S5]-alanine N-acetyltransferase